MRDGQNNRCHDNLLQMIISMIVDSIKTSKQTKEILQPGKFVTEQVMEHWFLLQVQILIADEQVFRKEIC